MSCSSRTTTATRSWSASCWPRSTRSRRRRGRRPSPRSRSGQLERSTASCSTSTCPTPPGWTGCARLLQADAGAAVCVLTGLDDEHRGVEAVAAGAQDYLVKGQIDGELLARAIRYAVERRRAEASRARLLERAARARRERPAGARPAAGAAAATGARSGPAYRPGRRRALLGGDFYDAVLEPGRHGARADRRRLRARAGRGGARRLPAGRVAHAGAGRRREPTDAAPLQEVLVTSGTRGRCSRRATVPLTRPRTGRAERALCGSPGTRRRWCSATRRRGRPLRRAAAGRPPERGWPRRVTLEPAGRCCSTPTA